MNKYITSLLCACCLVVSSTSCQQVLIPDDVSGISLKSVDVFVEYTAAKVFGDINVKNNPDRISEVRVYYGTASDALDKIVKATYDTQNGYSADLTDLEDGVQYFYRVDIIVGRTPVEGIVNDFVTFPMGPVDLDLPSNKKWASHNVGARIPTERGDHFAWGETEVKEQYTWSTYKYCLDGDYNKLTKYVVDKRDAASGIPDNEVTLKEADDAASANMGAEWRTPTRLEWQELFDNSDKKRANINGIHGVILSSKKNKNDNKKFIFIPDYPGTMSGTSFNASGDDYWTATLRDDWNQTAIDMSVSTMSGYRSARSDGLGVRAIAK